MPPLGAAHKLLIRAKLVIKTGKVHFHYCPTNKLDCVSPPLSSPEGERISGKNEEVDKTNAETHRHTLLRACFLGSLEMVVVAVGKRVAKGVGFKLTLGNNGGH